MAVGLSGMLFLGVAEAAIRWFRPSPRVQIVRALPDRLGQPSRVLREIDGVTVWGLPEDESRRTPPCLQEHPDAPVVVVLGSSIFYGVQMDVEQVFTTRLQELLSVDGPVCVRNLAEPAFSFDGQAAVLAEAREQGRVDVVVWEMWHNSALPYTRLGPAAYRLRGLEVDEAGFPLPLVPLPSELHHTLFLRSALWEFASLALGRQREGGERGMWQDFTATTLPDAWDGLTEDGVELLVVAASGLGRPFAETRAIRAKRPTLSLLSDYTLLAGVAAEHDVPLVFLDERFGDRRVEDVRLDPCCHFNAEGHRILAETLAPDVAALLGR